MTSNVYQLAARVWFRESTGEWVLEVSGEINGTHFTSRHTQSGNLRPEDVAGLPELHAEAERYRWLKDHCQHVPDELGMAGQLYFGTYAGGELDTAIDTARATAAGGEEVL